MPEPDDDPEGDIDPVLVTLQFETDRPDHLLDLLARYVVVTRAHAGCRNVDLVASATVPGRFLVIEKWDTPTDQQRHFGSSDMVALASGCEGLLRRAPLIDLHEGISMHDLA